MYFAIAGLVLLVTAGLMLDSHRRKWLTINRELPEPRDKQQQRVWRIGRAEYLRRMQASGTIGFLGLLLGARTLVPEQPLVFAVYVCVLLLGCLWVIVLGTIDAWANMLRVAKTSGERDAARLRLEDELKRARQQTSDDE